MDSRDKIMLFRLTDVYKSYAAQDVLRGASLQVNPGEHVGLVGRNGAGKTTLFRMVTSEETPDRGDAVRARGLRLGLLQQHVHFEEDATVHEAALAAFGNLQRIEHEMHELEHRMAEAPDDLDKILERYSNLQTQFEREGGFEYGARAEAILQGLGFAREMWGMEVHKLSGGQQNRLGMARLLLAEPDVLLLDEPTNHLDVARLNGSKSFSPHIRKPTSSSRTTATFSTAHARESSKSNADARPLTQATIRVISRSAMSAVKRSNALTRINNS